MGADDIGAATGFHKLLVLRPHIDRFQAFADGFPERIIEFHKNTMKFAGHTEETAWQK